MGGKGKKQESVHIYFYWSGKSKVNAKKTSFLLQFKRSINLTNTEKATKKEHRKGNEHYKGERTGKWIRYIGLVGVDGNKWK